MADNLAVTEGAGKVLASDDIGGVHFPKELVHWGPDGTATRVDTGVSALPIQDGGNSITVDGTLTGVTTVGTITNVVHVDDNSSTLSIDDGGGAITVDGTVAATQSGTWNVTNVSGTVSLPTGAATAAKQPALGTAGTASSDVLTVQGITSMTALKVDGSAVTQPVSIASAVPITDNSGSLTVDGTVAATQSGTWNITNVSGTISLPTGASTAAKQPALGTAGTASSDVITVQGIASMTALKVDGSAVTQPVSAASLPLPSGAATAAKQPALGTAGSASADVITVQGVTSMTALKVDGSAVTQPVSGTVAFSNTTIAVTNAGTFATQSVCTNAGTFAVQATVAAGASTIGKAEDVASADADVGVPAMAVRKATPANTSGTDGDYEMLQMSAGRLWASATIDTALPAGTNAIGKLASNTGVTIGAVEIAATQTLATVTTVGSITAAVTANLAPTTSGGTTISRVISGASTNATSVKGSAGQLYALYVSNINASPRYLKLYNKASSPTVGTDTPVLTFLIPGNTSGAAGCFEFSNGIAFATGIALAITTGVADADTAAVAANELVVNVLYK